MSLLREAYALPYEDYHDQEKRDQRIQQRADALFDEENPVALIHFIDFAFPKKVI